MSQHMSNKHYSTYFWRWRGAIGPDFAVPTRQGSGTHLKFCRIVFDARWVFAGHSKPIHRLQVGGMRRQPGNFLHRGNGIKYKLPPELQYIHHHRLGEKIHRGPPGVTKFEPSLFEMGSVLHACGGDACKPPPTPPTQHLHSTSSYHPPQ